MEIPAVGHLYAILGHKYHQNHWSSHPKPSRRIKIINPQFSFNRKWVLSYLCPSVYVCSFQTFDLDLVSDSSNCTNDANWVLIWPCLRQWYLWPNCDGVIPGISDRLLAYYPNDIDAHIDSKHLSVSSVTLSATVETIHFSLFFVVTLLLLLFSFFSSD